MTLDGHQFYKKFKIPNFKKKTFNKKVAKSYKFEYVIRIFQELKCLERKLKLPRHASSIRHMYVLESEAL